MPITLSNPPTFREMSDLFDLMRDLNPADLRRCADDIISYASDNAIKEMFEFRQPGRDERSDIEKKLY